ncbi:beta-N-acetylhexosaminidase, partial [Streptomyces sp. NPDC004050]
MRVLRRTLGALLVLGTLVSCASARGADVRLGNARSGGPGPAAAPTPYERLLPAPASAQAAGAGYPVAAGTVVRTAPAGDAEVRRVGELLAEQLRGPTGLPLPVVHGSAGD